MGGKRMAIRNWRIIQIDGDTGVLVYVDPEREHIRLYEGGDPELGKRLESRDGWYEKLEDEISGQLSLLAGLLQDQSDSPL